MARMLVGFLLVVGLSGCAGPAPSPSTPATRSATPTPTMAPIPTIAPTPLVHCSLAAADCGPATTAVLAIVEAATAAAPTRIVLGRGILCPDPDLLFSLSTCPMGIIYNGSAIVTLAGTAAQAYLDLQGHGAVITAHLITIVVPPATPAPGSS